MRPPPTRSTPSYTLFPNTTLFRSLQIKFGRHVADRAIFVVEFLCLVRALAVAVDQMSEHLPMAHHVIAQVLRHEAGELQKARIDAAPGARIPEIGRAHV